MTDTRILRLIGYPLDTRAHHTTGYCQELPEYRPAQAVGEWADVWLKWSANSASKPAPTPPPPTEPQG